jgi:hypothetical protein
LTDDEINFALMIEREVALMCYWCVAKINTWIQYFFTIVYIFYLLPQSDNIVLCCVIYNSEHGILAPLCANTFLKSCNCFSCIAETKIITLLFMFIFEYSSSFLHELFDCLIAAKLGKTRWYPQPLVCKKI